MCDCVFVRDRPLSQCKPRFISLTCTSLVGMCTTRTTWFYTIKRGISEPPGPVGPVSREVRGAPPISCFVFLSDPCKIDFLCPEILGSLPQFKPLKSKHVFRRPLVASACCFFATNYWNRMQLQGRHAFGSMRGDAPGHRSGGPPCPRCCI